MKRRISILFLMMLFFPFVVKADSISLRCPSEYEADVEFSCDIYGESVSETTSIEADINLVNFTYKTFIPSDENDLRGEATYIETTKSYKVLLYSGKILKGSFKIGTLRVAGNNTSGKVILSGIVFDNNDNKDAHVDNVNKLLYLKANNVVSETKKEETKKTEVKNNASSSGSGNNASSSGSGNNVSSGKSANTQTDIKDATDTDDDTTVDEYDIDFTKGAYLKNLKINGYSIDFRSDIFQYKIKIGNEKKLEITPIGASEDITYKILGNENLKDGSVITIEVVYKEKNIQNYYINILKDKKSNKNVLKYILFGIIGALILINIVRFLIVRGGNNEENG